MAFRLRLLPMTMVATGMLLSVKVAAVIHGGEAAMQASFVSPVNAQTADDNKPAKPAEAASTSSSSSSSSSGESSTSSSTSTSSTSSSGAEGNAQESKPPVGKARKDQPSPPPTIEQQSGGRGLAPGTRYFSPIELEILQTLSKRRQTLEQWSKDVEVKENLLSNTEKRIDEKIAEISSLKSELQDMLDKYNQQEDAKIRSLVKIYENMNPKDAARIFDEVEMPILLLVIDRMSEKKAAPILAAMDPQKAKQLTVELAEERRLQSAKMTGRPPLTTAPVNATR